MANQRKKDKRHIGGFVTPAKFAQYKRLQKKYGIDGTELIVKLLEAAEESDLLPIEERSPTALSRAGRP